MCAARAGVVDRSIVAVCGYTPPGGALARLQLLLDRLDGVQKSGNGYRARCPACGGRSRKVSIRSDEDRVLLHCFGGCAAPAVLHAVDLQLGDLFEQRLRPDTPDERRARRRAWREHQWGAALEMLELESTILDLAARQLAAGEALSSDDLARVQQAGQRVEDARRELRGR